ncbi:MAG: hypothetical protein ACRCW0_08260 [Clostridium sp.]
MKTQELTIGEKAKKLLEMREEMLHYAGVNDLEGLLKLKDNIRDIYIDGDAVWLDGERIAKVDNIENVDINDETYSDKGLNDSKITITVEHSRPSFSGKRIIYNPFQRLIDEKEGKEFKGYDYFIGRM